MGRVIAAISAVMMMMLVTVAMIMMIITMVASMGSIVYPVRFLILDGWRRGITAALD